MRFLQIVAATLISAAILALPAVVNGYPLVFYDTADYLEMSFTFEPIVYRTMPYAVLLMPAHLHISLWLVVALQCLIAAWVIGATIRAFVPRSSPWTAPLVVAVLSLLTALPWYTGQLMPDFLGGLLILALATLVFARAALLLPEKIGLALVAVLAAACHSSYMLLAVGLAACAIIGWLWIWKRLRPGWAFVVLPVLVALAGIGTVGSVHYLASGRAYISQTGDVFLLARFIQDDLVGKYLDRVCPSPDYVLCQHRNDLPKSANDFLWAYDNLLDKMGGWEKAEDEARRIVRGSLAAFPLDHARAALHDVAQQLVMFRSGDGTWSQTTASAVIVWRYFPTELNAYLNSFQQNDRFDFDRINQFHIPAALAGVVGIFLMGAIAWRRRDFAGAGLAVVIVLGLLGNAVICSVLSNPGDRYASRMMWLGLFGTMVLIARARRLRQFHS
ncbi:MAG: hypothetical protein ABI439_05630 [Rhodospirillales bacterium]